MRLKYWSPAAEREGWRERERERKVSHKRINKYERMKLFKKKFKHFKNVVASYPTVVHKETCKLIISHILLHKNLTKLAHQYNISQMTTKEIT